jgi:PAS domain S-box-containing protein
MWYLSQIHLIALVTYIYLAIYILAQNPKQRLNRSCSVFIACLAIWSLEKVFYSAPGITAEQARFWNDIGSLGWIGLSPAFLWFAQTLTEKAQRPLNRRLLSMSVAIAVILIVAQYQERLIPEFIHMPYGWTWRWSMDVWMQAFFLFYLINMITGMIMLLNYSRRASGIALKKTALLIFLYTVIGLGMASITDTVLPMIGVHEIPPLGNALCLIWALALGYSIVKYKFLDLSPATAAENIITVMSDLLILTDARGRIIRVNQAVEKCLELSRPDIEGRHVSDFFPDTDRNPNKTTEDRPVRIENRRITFKVSSGRSVAAILSSSPVLEGDQPAGNVILIKDISDLQHTEKALKLSEERYRELVETINEVAYSLDSRGRITYLSPRFHAWTGYTTDDVKGKRLIDFIHSEDITLRKHGLDELFKGRVDKSTYRLQCEDGEYRWVQNSSRPILSDGRVIGANGILTDITDQINAQEERVALETRLARAEKMEAIGTLAGAVAHDLNNVLSGIVSYPQLLLLETPGGSRTADILQTIKSSGEKAAAIVEDLLTLARRGVTISEQVNLNKVITDYLDSPEHLKLKDAFPKARIDFHQTPEPCLIMGSPLHLSKAIMNLMANALESLPAEGGHVILSTEIKQTPQVSTVQSGDASPKTRVVVKIKDTGKGIAPEDQERIFEPFFTRKVMGRSGTGLGMAVVWGAVQDHNGHIELKSRLGEGTSFTISFPMVSDEESPEKQPRERNLHLGRGESILIVDDEPYQRKIASEILIRMGYTVHSVSSGESAVEFLGNQTVDLVILDMIMEGGMDGLDTYSEIKKTHPHQKVIIASGYSTSERIREALQCGVLGWVKKPYLMEEIGDKVLAALVSQKNV